MKTAIYVMSCDKNLDVLNHCIISFEKYFNDCNLKFFIGANSPSNFVNNKYDKVIANKSNWKEESLIQINKIKESDKDISHLIVILDDFVFNKKVKIENLKSLISDPKLINIKYLRLKQIEESFLKNILTFFKHKEIIGTSKIYKIRKSHPYYFSLQIAIWDINYLYESIQNSKDIWHFENQNTRNLDHWSVTNNIFHYRHVVEKGKWEHYAQSYCNKHINYFEPGFREIIKDNFINRLIIRLKIVKFFFLGYIKLN